MQGSFQGGCELGCWGEREREFCALFLHQRVWELGVFGWQGGGKAPAFPVAHSLGSEIGNWPGLLLLHGDVSTPHSDKACRGRELGRGEGAGRREALSITTAGKELEKQISKPGTRRKCVPGFVR